MGARVSLVLLFIAVLGIPTLCQQSSDEPVYVAGHGGVSWPTPVKQVNPQYTQAAKEAKIQGTVKIEGIIEPDGSLDELKVVKSLDKEHGLDQAALDAAGQWKFEPGKKDGKPVRVHAELEMEFSFR